MGRVVISFTLDTVKDRDILRWLERQDGRHRSAAIREALRAHMAGGVTLGDVYQAIKGLERKLKSGVVAVPADADWEEPPEAAAALDALANL